MTTSLFLSLAESVVLKELGNGDMVFEGPVTRLGFKQLPSGIRTSLMRLATDGELQNRIEERVQRTDGSGAFVQLYYVLERLTQHKFLLHSVQLNGQQLATLIPISKSFELKASSVNDEQEYALSRFSYMRREGNSMYLESPRSHAKIVLHDWRATAVVHTLAKPCRLRDIVEQISGIASDTVGQILTLLIGAEMVSELRGNQTLAEDCDSVLRCWEFHDLLFHTRSRSGRHDYPLGFTNRFVGQFDQPPSQKESQSSEALDLPRPDLDRLCSTDLPFAYVQETRRSIRSYADQPIDVRQLGEFLYRVARVKEQPELGIKARKRLVKLNDVRRPYPSAGMLYELDLRGIRSWRISLGKSSTG